jgi:hypothetical protein
MPEPETGPSKPDVLTFKDKAAINHNVYKLTTERLQLLSNFLACFAPAIGETVSFDLKVDDLAEEETVDLRDKAVKLAFRQFIDLLDD